MPSIVCCVAVAVEALTTARDGRATVALKPGTLRQPSSSSCMPSRSTNSGLTKDEQLRRIAADARVDDEDAQRHADLRRRQPDARAPRTSSRSCRRSSCCDRRRDRRRPARPAGAGRRRRSGGSDGASDASARREAATCSRSANRASSQRCAGCADLGDRVAAELLEHRVGEHERDHRLADDRRRRHGADVAALDRRRRLRPSSSDRPSAAASSASRSASCSR